MREPLEVGLKLAATLRFLATGNSYPSLQYSFRVENAGGGFPGHALARLGTQRPAVFAPSLRSVHAWFTQVARTGHEIYACQIFEHFKILSTTWHASPHTSRTPHARLRQLYALPRLIACHCGNKNRASVSGA